MSVIKISPSKLSCAENCHRQFYLRYVIHTRVFAYVFPALPVGTAFHTLMEIMYSKRIWNPEEVETYIDKAWYGALARAKISPQNSTPEKIKEHKDKIRRLFRKSFEYHKKNNLIDRSDIEVLTEQRFEIRVGSDKIPGLPPGIEVGLNGIIDRIMIDKTKKEAWVTDYKTTKDIPDQKKVDQDIQLTFYDAAYRRLAANKIDGSWPKKAKYVELFFPVISDSIQTTRRKEHFEDMKKRVANVVEIEQKQIRDANPSEDACKWCEYKYTEHCPESRKGR